MIGFAAGRASANHLLFFFFPFSLQLQDKCVCVCVSASARSDEMRACVYALVRVFAQCLAALAGAGTCTSAL